jgi:hypothetical protein
LGNGGDGEAIAFKPVDGLMYHASGSADPNDFTDPNHEIKFETIDLGTRTVSDPEISLSVPFPDDSAEFFEFTGLTYDAVSGDFLGGDVNLHLVRIGSDGSGRFIGGSTTYIPTGLAFVSKVAFDHFLL